MKKITLIIYTLTVFIFLSLTQKTNAQLQNTNWYFGSQIGLNFNDGTLAPTVLMGTSLMDTSGGSASVSDDLGNLLFYTNGISVWNNLHQVMPNGTGLLAGANISQSVIIVPDPSNTNRYYIFTNQGDSMGTSGLYYSIIDMTLDNGSGDIDINNKNIYLQLEYVSEKITAVFNPNDDSYWVVAFAPSDDPTKSDTFYTYKVDQFGVILDNQTTFIFPYSESGSNKGGQMKISPDGQSLALIHNLVEPGIMGGFDNAQSLFTLDFDMSTGTVSNLNSTIDLTDNLYSYGLEFSPDSNLLYASTTNRFSDEAFIGRVHQIEYRNPGGVISTTIFDGFDPIYSLQLGIDGKIYAVNDSGSLSTINSPNTIGVGANYADENVNLNKSANRDLPQLVPINTNVPAEPPVVGKVRPVILGNPFKDVLKIKFDEVQTYTIEFYNTVGSPQNMTEPVKTVIYEDMKNKKVYKINTTDLPTGTYYLIIRDEQSEVWHETALKVQ